jgi:hypothetical protein
MPQSKTNLRRLASRKAAKEVLQDLITGRAEAYDAFRRLYGLWCANNAALEELRPLFQMEGIEPDGRISVTAEFQEQIRSVAKGILPDISD